MKISGWIILGLGTVVVLLKFFAAAKLSHLTPRLRPDGRPVSNPIVVANVVRLSGIAFFALTAAMAFGLIPLADIQTIQLH